MQRIDPQRKELTTVALLLRPVQRFMALEASSGILLMGCAVVAMVWANSPWADGYFHLWETYVTIGAKDFGFSASLHHWINDGLMAIFFFLVGLEIKREMLIGELSSPRKAALPMVAALGGMVVPAGIYAALNWGTDAISGWGIPMATDIAFALGVLALLGKRAPLSLKVFLTALAIVDDLGAVLVIALFYTEQIHWAALAFGGACLLLSMLLNLGGVRRPIVYALIGIALWAAFLESGVHATVAGVLLALTIPARQRTDAPAFLARAQELITEFRQDVKDGVHRLTEDQADAVLSLEQACEEVQMPLQRIEHELAPWVAFIIVPLFALANAGVAVGGDVVGAFTDHVTLGVILGLVIGKQIGVTLFAWLAVKLNLAELPADANWRQVYGISWLCGIGFTMSLFIANLAFDDAVTLDHSKIGILSASVVAGVIGFVILWRQSAPIHPVGQTITPPPAIPQERETSR